MLVGLGLSENVPLHRQADVARQVEDAGLVSLWTNEASGRDALLLCHAWATATTTLRVGVGVVPIWTRSPAQLAMGAATLAEASVGRFVLGLGVSHPVTMGAWHGADVRRPLTAVREYTTIVRSLLSGTTADVDGDVFSARRFRLAIDPLPAPTPVHLAAMGPRMLALAGEIADGVLLNWSSPDEVRRGAAIVRDGGRPVEVAAYVRVAVAADRGTARAALAREIGNYCALPAYAEHFRRQGLGRMVEAAKAAHREGGSGAVAAALDDEDISRVGWFGTPQDDPRPALAAYADAGLDHLVARVVVADGDVHGALQGTLTALSA